MHTIRVNSEKSKSKKVESGHYTFPNCYTLCSTKEAINNTASFGGVPRISGKIHFYTSTLGEV